MVRRGSNDLIRVSSSNTPEKGENNSHNGVIYGCSWSYRKYVASMPTGDRAKSRVAVLLYV